MLGRGNDLEIDDKKRVKEYAMTSLGKLIYMDTHSRYPNNSTSADDAATIDSSETLSLAFENLFYMPFDIIENYGSTIHTLDLSHNKFCRNLQFLAEFENLTSLNLDHNSIDSFTCLPHMPKLQLLWLNHNNIVDLFPFVKNLYESVPNLRYLCLMGNKAAPSYLNGGTFYDYLQYRLFVISWFPRLIHLDDREVTREQRIEAKRLFKRPIFENFAENAPLPECLKLIHAKITNFFSKPVMPDRVKIQTPNLVV
ncbi:leucine-rich melanocyte differentiation-associated protein-like isoform X2 [Venturia canescens]|uniref:leucine-rich melanocyte differentiation-associated protein-like isoform X2 n=1 Tax=Venturia canescens TaxID=32260 RepID=UPI001C9BF885|nr:leucine-rich melanocyte differentiation-associated protein-like isoform X2 [Venturia canescens]